MFRKQDSPESPAVIFISFHNYDQIEDADVRQRSVEGLCQLVSMIRKLTQCMVLVGIGDKTADTTCGARDFNQRLICPIFDYAYHTILDYTPTDRQLQSGQIDYFILDPPDCPIQQHDVLKLIERITCSRLTDEQITH